MKPLDEHERAMMTAAADDRIWWNSHSGRWRTLGAMPPNPRIRRLLTQRGLLEFRDGRLLPTDLGRERMGLPAGDA